MTLYRILSTAALAIAIVEPVHAAEVGVRDIKVTAPERGQDLAVTVWYPAGTGGEAIVLGDNKAFKGVPAFKNAPLLKGRFPLVVLSHGSGGRVQGMAWLASELAKAGFIVAGPNHPGTTSGDSTPADTPKLWERTQDISAVIDAMTADPTWRSVVDGDKVGVVGFSLGGAAAMEIAGARASLDAYAHYCDEYKKWDCAWYAGGIGYRNDAVVHVDKLDLRTIDKARFDQSNLDRRVKAAVLVDPGLALAFDAESLKAIKIPMDFINLGSANTIPLGVIADKLAALTPRGTYATVEGAIHFSFLQECKPGAAEMLKEAGEVDPICADGGGRSRADLHAELVGLIRGDLERSLKEPM
jgi:predicted dienelactone hydrolase